MQSGCSDAHGVSMQAIEICHLGSVTTVGSFEGSLKVVHCFEMEENTLQILVEAMTANMIVAVEEGNLVVGIAAEELYLGICRQLHPL